MPSVCKRKCVEEKMDRTDLVKHEEFLMEDQQEECEETAVANSFCVEGLTSLSILEY